MIPLLRHRTTPSPVRIERARLRAAIKAMADRLPWSDVMLAIQEETRSVAAERREQGEALGEWVV